MLIIGNGRLLTRDERNTYHENGAVCCDGGVIVEIGKTAALKQMYPEAEFLDAGGGVIMPGLINAHSHIYSALSRGLSIKGYNPVNFYEVLDGMWWAIDRRLTLAGTRCSASQTYIDSIKNGVTTLYDHHAGYGAIEGSLFEIADVARAMHYRTCLCYEVSDRDGKEKRDAAIRENAEFIKHAKAQNSDMIKAMFGLHAAFTLSDETLELCFKHKPADIGFHIHVAEGMNDVYDSLDRYAKRTVNRLHDMGILGKRTIAGHCIHLSPGEMELLKATDTMVVNNPESNMGNAVGCSPVLQLMDRQILVGLGTDAYTHDMLESLKVALLIQRHNAMMPNVGWREVMQMLFYNNAKIGARAFTTPLGVLAPGAAADIAVFDYKPFTPFGADNADGHILFGFSGKGCVHTVIDGKIAMKDRTILCCDEEEINAKTLETAKKLWGSLNG
ncbi:MAG: putative aminohydrolase SsnA [Clostridiales bacterium]|jgi:putative selenium metabolism protein SsnA|nr:putative aminohydrolase SsnA [Clostridiales bacterium]